MGQIAQQAQGQQMVEMTPKRNLKMMMKKSWPRIASVVGNNISPDRSIRCACPRSTRRRNSRNARRKACSHAS